MVFLNKKERIEVLMTVDFRDRKNNPYFVFLPILVPSTLDRPLFFDAHSYFLINIRYRFAALPYLQVSLTIPH